jgi:hypothetical protein
MDKIPAEKSGIRIEVLATIIAAIFTVATFLVALLAYLRPTDATHPPHFDFLTRTLSFPMWVGVGLVFGVVAASAWLFRFGVTRGRRVQKLEVQAPSAASSKVSSASPKPSAPSIQLPEPQRHHPQATGDGELSIDSPDDYTINIRRLGNAEMKGLAYNIDNHRLDTIGKVSITIYSAQSFSSYHGEFRDGAGFKAARYPYQGNINSSTSGHPGWIIRKDPTKSFLLAADDNTHEMIWPDNDKAEIQRWRMEIGLTAETIPPAAGIPAKGLTTQPFHIIVSWNTKTNEFFLEKEEDK